MKRVIATFTVLMLALIFQASSERGNLVAATQQGARVDPLLQTALAQRATVPAIITYSSQPNTLQLNRLKTVGILKGFALRQLPMVIADLNAVQLSAVRNQPGVISVWANRVMKPFMHESRAFIGVDKLMADGEVTARNTANPGQPVSGKGIGIGYIDTGIDGTQKDLEFGSKTVQNVIQPLAQGVVSDAGLVLGVGVSISDLIAGTGFVPPIYIENAPTSDLESGHGTHGAGVAAGTGANSGGFYGGVAQGAKLVGIDAGDDKGLPLVAILTAYDYLFVNQFLYNIRVINNSWGSSLDAEGVDPANPVNVATRRAHDHNVTVVFAAGNAGDTPTSINPYSTMPWTISVAAGEKQGLGTPAGFSSRGVDDGTGSDIAGQPSDETLPPNLRPDITAPGVAIISVKAHGVSPIMNAGGVINGDPLKIPPAFLPNYLSSQGTSFACPHVSGVVALMLEARPTLTPDEVVTILRNTATPMPFAERVVGAGYVDAHNAVRSILNLSAVAKPNLFPEPGLEITDPADDQLGTTAQDIRSADFSYDAAARQIVYTLTVNDMSQRTPGSVWTLDSSFGPSAVFVSIAINELSEATYEYGIFTTLPNGTTNQESLGEVDSGVIEGNQIIVRLSLDKVNAAVGGDVLNSISTATRARSQILIGTSASGGLLLQADAASGSDFEVNGGSSTPGPESNIAGQLASFTERFAGSIKPGQGAVEIPLGVRLPVFDAKLNCHPANEQLTLQLIDRNNRVVAQSGTRSLTAPNLAEGDYKLRVAGSPSRPVDFVIKGRQASF